MTPSTLLVQAFPFRYSGHASDSVRTGNATRAAGVADSTGKVKEIITS